MPDPESSADRIVASLHNVDEKVNALREQRINDPDDLCDKMFKVAAPTLVGLVFGKLFGLGALVSQLSDRGSQALVDRRHSRQSRRIR